MNGCKPISGSDRKSTRLNSSHLGISYAVFCLHVARPPSTPFPYTTLFRSRHERAGFGQSQRVYLEQLRIFRDQGGVELLEDGGKTRGKFACQPEPAHDAIDHERLQADQWV